MRFSELICLSVLAALFSTMLSDGLSQLIKLEKKLSCIRKKTESLHFISESFKNACEDKGFSSFDEWETVCSALWELDSIEWKIISQGENEIYYGSWKGESGNGEVYAQKKRF